MNKVRAHLIIEGLVQGVGFRASAAVIAKKNNVCGWVKNNPGDTVEAVLEGGEEDVKRVIEWCQRGPSMARVERVNVSWEPFRSEFDDFTALTRYNHY